MLDPKGNKVEKKKPVMFGRKFANIQAGTTKAPFSVHEDLLCSRSDFFKERLQKNRQSIEGKCGICHEDFDVEKDNISHCQSCGQNIHNGCIDTWLSKKGRGRSPYCRANWVSESKIQTLKCPQLDSDGFDAYVKWIYGKRLPIYKTDLDNLDVRFLRLIKTWNVANVLGERELKVEIIEQIAGDVKEHDFLPGALSMEYVFKTKDQNEGSWVLCSFFIDIFVVKGSYHRSMWFDDLEAPWVANFLKNLNADLMKEKEEKDKDEHNGLDIDDLVDTYTFKKKPKPKPWPKPQPKKEEPQNSSLDPLTGEKTSDIPT